MINKEERPNKVWRRYLYAAYGIAAVAFVIAIGSGRFAPNSRFTSDIAPAIVLLLAFATALVNGPISLRSPPVPRQRAVVDVFKAIACWIIAIAWIAGLARRVPDTTIGVTLLVAPALGVGLWGAFYVWRSSQFLTGRIMRTLLMPRTAVDSSPREEFAKWAGDSSDRIEIPVDYGAVILKLILGLCLYAAAWWLLGRGSVLVSTIFAVGTVYVIYLNSRVVFGYGPGLVLSPSGISLRKGLGLVSDLAWSEATTVEIKVTKLYSCIVIGMRNADRLIEDSGGYRRWALRSNLQRFGSPFLVFSSSLKCDRQRLFQMITAYRLRYGTR
jgi:hypothetical protein